MFNYVCPIPSIRLERRSGKVIPLYISELSGTDDTGYSSSSLDKAYTRLG